MAGQQQHVLAAFARRGRRNSRWQDDRRRTSLSGGSRVITVNRNRAPANWMAHGLRSFTTERGWAGKARKGEEEVRTDQVFIPPDAAGRRSQFVFDPEFGA